MWPAPRLPIVHDELPVSIENPVAPWDDDGSSMAHDTPPVSSKCLLAADDMEDPSIGEQKCESGKKKDR
jgi:hypothetical protein